MRVMSQSPDPLARMHTMTKRQGKSGTIDVKALMAEDDEFLRALVRTALQEVLEAEMREALGAEKGERATGRQGYWSGYYGRTLITRVGKLELRVPQDRTGASRPSCSNATSVRSGRWWRRWRRCTCKGFRLAK
jgi:transposase-like protein